MIARLVGGIIPVPSTVLITSSSGGWTKNRFEASLGFSSVDKDFTQNMMTVLCEARAVHYVKSNYVGAFVKGTFATDKAAIAKA